MLAHDIKNILELVPSAMEFVKQASIEDEYPVDSPDSTIASGLRINYLIKVAHQPVDLDTINMVKKAGILWGVQDKINELSVGLIKKASETSRKDAAAFKQNVFMDKIGGFNTDHLELAKEAAFLVHEYEEHVDSEDVLRYACQGELNKQAAVDALNSRAYVTGNDQFIKLAEALVATKGRLETEELQKLAECVTMLDKKANLQVKGFNFYREAIMVKEADIKSCMTVMIDGKDVPYEKIQRLGKDRIASALGSEFGTALGSGPVSDKEVLETLPLDLQKVLAAQLRGV